VDSGYGIIIEYSAQRHAAVARGTDCPWAAWDQGHSGEQTDVQRGSSLRRRPGHGGGLDEGKEERRLEGGESFLSCQRIGESSRYDSPKTAAAQFSAVAVLLNPISEAFTSKSIPHIGLLSNRSFADKFHSNFPIPALFSPSLHRRQPSSPTGPYSTLYVIKHISPPS